MDFSNSVIMPREDFIELTEVAYNQPKPSGTDRLITTAQTTLFFAAATGAVTAGCWAWAKASNWLEEQNFQRSMRRTAKPSTPKE